MFNLDLYFYSKNEVSPSWVYHQIGERPKVTMLPYTLNEPDRVLQAVYNQTEK